jgi:hypothetical protein
VSIILFKKPVYCGKYIFFGKNLLSAELSYSGKKAKGLQADAHSPFST